jgi:hypothetical protein
VARCLQLTDFKERAASFRRERSSDEDEDRYPLPGGDARPAHKRHKGQDAAAPAAAGAAAPAGVGASSSSGAPHGRTTPLRGAAAAAAAAAPAASSQDGSEQE